MHHPIEITFHILPTSSAKVLIASENLDCFLAADVFWQQSWRHVIMLQHNEIHIEVEVTLSPIWVSVNGNKGSHYYVVLPYHALMPCLYSSCVPHARSLGVGTTRLSQLASKGVDVNITKSLESSNVNMRGHGTRESWLSWFGWLIFPPFTYHASSIIAESYRVSII